MINILTAEVVCDMKASKETLKSYHRTVSAKLKQFFTVIIALKHLHFFFVIGPTEKLTLLDNILIAFLQSYATYHTQETFQMEYVVDCSHYKLIAADFFRTTETTIFHEKSLIRTMHVGLKRKKRKENGFDYLIFQLYRPINCCAQRVNEILSFFFFRKRKTHSIERRGKSLLVEELEAKSSRA
jgi:hypothetical protein